MSRDADLGGIRCSYCRFANECRPGIDTKQAYFDTWPERKLPTGLDHNNCLEGISLDEAYDVIKGEKASNDAFSAAESFICKIMEDNKIKKLRFADGEVYECKLLKSPRPHFELRRSK